MLFTTEFTIPKNTVSKTPVRQTLKIARGTINRFIVYPRPGHAGLAHMVIRYHGHQIAPSNEGMNLSGDAHPIDWDDERDIDTPPYEIILEGWNDDDTYPHTFYVAISIIPDNSEADSNSESTIQKVLDVLGLKRIFE